MTASMCPLCHSTTEYNSVECGSCDYQGVDGKVQVSIYAVDRRFGGHEEGGWWYDWYEFTGISSRVAPDAIDVTKAELLLLFAEAQPNYPVSSCASDGPEYRAIVESKAGGCESTVRPHYE